MSVPLALYCKSYRTDLNRVVRLARSIERFNVESIPFYVSVPQAEAPLFKEHLAGLKVDVLDDDLIIASNTQIKAEDIHALPGHISQQIIKSEFWRLNLADVYMCLDSDAFFIRPFRHQDYLWQNEIPYTVLDEGHEFLGMALSSGKNHIVKDFLRDAQRVQNEFGRQGRVYSFAPFPVLWHRAVWESLHTEFLRPKGMSLLNAILNIPVESHWYGEALLRYQAIPLMPCQPLFKVYHYAWQLDRDRRAHVGPDQLAQLYSGIIYQSAWERDMDWPSEGGSLLSRVARRLRRRLGRT
jgi:hypothetical protein